ncbi:MAG: hypothetical protein ACE5FS_13385 [Paracoccaceae bacterium]
MDDKGQERRLHLGASVGRLTEARAPVFNFARLVFSLPLYEPMEAKNLHDIRPLFTDDGVKIRGACVECGTECLFHSRSLDESSATQDVTGVRNAKLACQNNPSHAIYLSLHLRSILVKSKLGNRLMQGAEIIKTGQYPSLAELTTRSLEPYEAFLPAKDRAEIAKSMQLASSGAHLGAVSYLRRVFGRLIDRSFENADLVMEQADFDRLTMDEKIDFLRRELPPQLVENRRGVATVFSRNPDTMSEEEAERCADLLSAFILLALSERKIEIERAKTKVTVDKAVSAFKAVADDRLVLEE